MFPSVFSCSQLVVAEMVLVGKCLVVFSDACPPFSGFFVLLPVDQKSQIKIYEFLPCSARERLSGCPSGLVWFGLDLDLHGLVLVEGRWDTTPDHHQATKPGSKPAVAGKLRLGAKHNSLCPQMSPKSWATWLLKPWAISESRCFSVGCRVVFP